MPATNLISNCRYPFLRHSQKKNDNVLENVGNVQNSKFSISYTTDLQVHFNFELNGNFSNNIYSIGISVFNSTNGGQ